MKAAKVLLDQNSQQCVGSNPLDVFDGHLVPRRPGSREIFGQRDPNFALRALRSYLNALSRRFDRVREQIIRRRREPYRSLHPPFGGQPGDFALGKAESNGIVVNADFHPLILGRERGADKQLRSFVVG